MPEGTYRYIEDETVVLDDGQDYRNAIFRRCKLTFRGGPVQIDNALFLECKYLAAGNAIAMEQVNEAIFRSLYLEGYRRLALRPDGTYQAE